MNTLFEEIYKTFGLQLKTKQAKGYLESIDIDHEDGATEVLSSEGGVVGLSFDMFNTPTNEMELIKTYRSLALTSDVDRILSEIRNEIFVFDEFGKKAVDIQFTFRDKPTISQSLMDKIQEEYDAIYNIIDFNNKGLEYFDRWYIDGRLFLHKIVDKKDIKKGIQKVICIDPLKIRKIVEYPMPNEDGVYDLNKIETYFIFSDTTDVYSGATSRFMKISKDAIAYSDSGIYDYATGNALSYLWKMIIPYNNMRMMEEALLVYRVVRSPERRAFYISVGNLSKPKAEAYIRELMSKFKNKLVYDSKTGAIMDRKNIMSMVEDYWLPRRDDGKGTEIQTLPGATNLGSIDDVDMFRRKFLESSNIPYSRFREEGASLIFGRSAEISRDEFRFKKFLDRLRKRFIVVIEDLLKTQLIIKNIILESDWEEIKKNIYWFFLEDNNFVQWKESEVLNSRIESMTGVDQFVGKYFNREWVLKNVLRLGDEDIKALLKSADDERQQLYPQDNPYGETPSGENNTNNDYQTYDDHEEQEEDNDD